MTLAVQVEGSDITTVEGLAPEPGRLSVLQAAFRRHHALQCGFCTAGILMSLDTLLQAEPEADAGRIREVLSGHLCRCTGYHQILDAAVEAARALRKETQNA
jgi:2-furoyl-CoA dehydrogenase 2Fe-2S iron sulfur subunit